MLCQHFAKVAKKAVFAVGKLQCFLIKTRRIDSLVNNCVLRSRDKREKATTCKKLHMPSRIFAAIFQESLCSSEKQIFQRHFRHQILKLETLADSLQKRHRILKMFNNVTTDNNIE